MNKEFIKTDSDNTSGIIAKTYSALIEGLTGIGASDRQALVLSLGRILQRARGGEFLLQLQSEWNEYRDKGKISDEYVNTEQHKECLQDLLDYLDGHSPDQLRFNAIKRVLLNAAELNESESVLPQQYIRLITQLSSGEAILLFTEYKLILDGYGRCANAQAWLLYMASSSPLEYPELVELHEQGLMSKRLITPRTHSDLSGIGKGFRGYRITEFGFKLCEYIKANSIDANSYKNDA